jgi:hypothetical protein
MLQSARHILVGTGTDHEALAKSAILANLRGRFARTRVRMFSQVETLSTKHPDTDADADTDTDTDTDGPKY